jgi:glucans biosynthesis protein
MNIRFPILVICFATGAVLYAAQAPAPTTGFTFEEVRLRAQELASTPYIDRQKPLPDWLDKLTYDEYRDIRFAPVQSYWNRARLPFKLQFFHPGFVFKRTIQLNEVSAGVVKPIDFEKKFFDYGHNKVGLLPTTIGFAGFRFHGNLNTPGDELGVFQGASYFRFLCRKAVYGISARGLALDTGEPTGEEFPNFEEFWIVRPVAGAKSIACYALLDGPSATGAYRFEIVPGDETQMRVRAVVYLRKNPKVVGIAPLTSMFWHGKNSNEQTNDYRPEVHDSDGLLVHTGLGEWLWRPLDNPHAIKAMSFMDFNPIGFGLMQRERRFSAYEDLEANYHARPNVWVEPVGDWGKGSVRLIELPTADETSDNIVAFWVPETLPEQGLPIDLQYVLHWNLDQNEQTLAHVFSTRHGRSRTFETDLERFIIDFEGANFKKTESDAPIQPVVWAGEGATLVHSSVERNPLNDSWRVNFALRPDGTGHPVELRCMLRRPSGILTETWSYLWQP